MASLHHSHEVENSAKRCKTDDGVSVPSFSNDDTLKNSSSSSNVADDSKNFLPSSDKVQKKHTVKLVQAHYGAKGRRKTMEDAHLVLEDEEIHQLFPDFPAMVRVSMYGIFDGHGGRCVADYVKDTLPQYIMKNIIKELAISSTEKKQQTELTENAYTTLPVLPNSSSSDTALSSQVYVKVDPVLSDLKIESCLKQAYQAMDIDSQNKAKQEGWNDGCCAVLLFVFNDMAYVVNMGDSKAVLCRQRKKIVKSEASSGASGGKQGKEKGPPLTHGDVGGDGSVGAEHKHCFPWNSTSAPTSSSSAAGASTSIRPPPDADAMTLTQDHKPILLSEKSRIEKHGGKVVNGRVNGALEVARSFGDISFKPFGVLAEPDLRVKFKLSLYEEFVVLGCDGLFNRYSDSNVVAFVRNRLYSSRSWCGGREYSWNLEKVAKALVEDAIHAKGTQDNCSAMIIRFQHPKQRKMPF